MVERRLFLNKLRLSEAAAYAGLSEFTLLQAVVEGDLRVGVMGRNWIGLAYPHPSDEQLPRGDWTSHYQRQSEANEALRVYHLRHPSGAEYSVQECMIGQFWYLHPQHSTFSIK